MQELRLGSRAELVRYALANGLLDEDSWRSRSRGTVIRMSRRLTRTAVVALAALAFGLAVTRAATRSVGGGAGGGTAGARAVADRDRAAGAPTWSARSTASRCCSRTRRASTCSRAASARTTAQLARFERTLAGCTGEIARLGPAPDALTTVRRDALRACRSLESGARLVRDGVERVAERRRRSARSTARRRRSATVSAGRSRAGQD